MPRPYLHHFGADAETMIRFYGLSVNINSQTRALLDQFMNGRSAKLCTVSVETGWFPYAIQDLALFHGTIYHWAALNREILPENLKNSKAIWQHKGCALRLVNDRLMDASVRIREATIASVACLASISILSGEMEESRAHVHGLMAIVHTVNRQSLRGRLILRLAKSTDSHHSQLFNVPLLFMADLPSTDMDHTSDLLEELGSNDPQAVSVRAGSSAIRKVTELQAQHDSVPASKMSEKERAEFGENLLESDRVLLHCIHSDDQSQLPNFNVSKATNLAVLIYSNIYLRLHRSSSPQSRSLCVQLKNALANKSSPQSSQIEVSPFVSENENDSKAYVWPLLLGAFRSESDKELREWFLERLKEVYMRVDRLNLPSWEDISTAIDAMEEGRWLIRSPKVRELLDIRRFHPL